MLEGHEIIIKGNTITSTLYMYVHVYPKFLIQQCYTKTQGKKKDLKLY